MASGLPILTTRCEGVEELIGDNGIVAENANPESIAQAMQKIMVDETLYKQMSLVAREKAENFTWGHSAQDYVTLYRVIAQGKSQ
jgi:glycosyltransferase involved in cell wall biosynthesis